VLCCAVTLHCNSRIMKILVLWNVTWIWFGRKCHLCWCKTKKALVFFCGRNFSVVAWLSACHIGARTKGVVLSILRLAIFVDSAATRSVLLLGCLEMVTCFVSLNNMRNLFCFVRLAGQENAKLLNKRIEKRT